MNIIVKRSLRAKRTSIRVRQGQVILTLTKKGSLDKAYEFLNSHFKLIQKRIAAFKPTSFNDGDTIKILGKDYSIVYSPNYQIKDVILSDNQIIISAKIKDLEDSIVKFLSNYLKSLIITMAPDICKKIGVAYSKISVKKMYSRWGSCSSNGNLSFCWKLVHLNEKILKYVVVHEICHLKEMNHSKRFWDLVESVYPDWRNARLELKNEGTKIL